MPKHPMRRILVTGASGMLGRTTLSELVKNSDLSVIGQAFSRIDNGLLQADLTDPTQVAKLIKESRPDCIVHCAAERRPDISEGNKPATDALNQHAVATLAHHCKANNIFLIYLSTDYVFDGKDAPYSTTAIPNPLNHYGQSKLAGEREAQACGDETLILRVPILYGPIQSLEESAVTTISKHLLDKTPKPIDHWAQRYPTATTDVARVIAQIIQYRSQHPDFHGTYHWSGNECFTKYEMAQIIGKAWELDTTHLNPDSNTPAGAPRPKDCQLDTSSLTKLGIQSYTPFSEAIASVLSPFKPQ